MLINSPNISGSLTVTGNSVITGSLTVLGGINGAITGSATTASYVEYSNVANKPTLVSGSSQITYSGLTGIPSGIVSGSSQITYSDLTGIPSGILSGSAQIADFGIFATTGSNQFNGNQAITGSLTTTGTIVAQTLNVQQVTSSIVYSSGSNIFGNDLGNTQQFTGSVGVTGSLTVVGAGTFASSVTAATLSTIGTAVAGQNVQLNLNGVSGKAQRIEFQNSGVQQWLIGAGAANETNNFEIYNSNGQMALSFAKSTSAATFSSSVTASGGASGVGFIMTNTTNSRQVTIGYTSGGVYNYIQAYDGTNFQPLVLNNTLTLASTGAATFSSSVTATQFITGGTPSNTAGFTNSFYAESSVPSLTLSNTGVNTGKYTIGVTNGNLGIWNNATSSYPLFINSSNNVLIGTTTDSGGKLQVSYAGTANNVIRLIGGGGTTAGNMLLSKISDYSDGSPINLFWAEHGSTGRTNTLVRIHTNETSEGGYPLRVTAQGTLSSPTYEALTVNYLGRVGIRNTAPQGLLEVGVVNNNNTYGGHFFSTFQIPQNTWTTVFTPPDQNWAAITEFTWTSGGDYNRSGAAYMRWAYEGGSGNIGVVYTLFNNSQNSTATFRYSGGAIQINITGGAVDYYVQVRIQGSKAA
jgi:hypothetical protein